MASSSGLLATQPRPLKLEQICRQFGQAEVRTGVDALPERCRAKLIKQYFAADKTGVAERGVPAERATLLGRCHRW